MQVDKNAMLVRTEEIFDSGKLVAEIFTKEPGLTGLFGELRKDRIKLENTHTYRDGWENELELSQNDADNISKVLNLWKKFSKSLYAYVARGAIFVGFLGYDFYRPYSNKSEWLDKNFRVETSRAPDKKLVDGLQKIECIYENNNKTGEVYVLEGDIKAEVKRFDATFFRKKSSVIIEYWDIPVFFELVETWKNRRQLY